MLTEEELRRLTAAISLIHEGEWKKIEVSSRIIVYRVEGAIRIDIKEDIK